MWINAENFVLQTETVDRELLNRFRWLIKILRPSLPAQFRLLPYKNCQPKDCDKYRLAVKNIAESTIVIKLN
ncbi:hypothetical protein T4B_10973 [Trichinella pseudospiralis]|uniref:Uncharacterized protein n=1 Tax=Trichinella pseudospiralis TaxID=6337 RepID=A0A0V1IJ80_TRIPS|nr:hypothetical protein T4B_10973 [Trichinella pseudospiralis]